MMCCSDWLKPEGCPPLCLSQVLSETAAGSSFPAGRKPNAVIQPAIVQRLFQLLPAPCLQRAKRQASPLPQEQALQAAQLRPASASPVPDFRRAHFRWAERLARAKAASRVHATVPKVTPFPLAHPHTPGKRYEPQPGHSILASSGAADGPKRYCSTIKDHKLCQTPQAEA